MTTFGVVARIKAPEGYEGVWVNIYKHGQGRYSKIQAGGAYYKRYQADMIAKSYRHDCTWVISKK